MIEQLIHKKPDEKVVFQLRRHPVIFAVDILLIVLFAAIPLVLNPIIGNTLPHLYASEVFRPVLVLLASAYYLLVWMFFYTNFVDFYLDLWVVTNNRILNVEQHGIFSRTVSELDLAQVQDVTSEQHGIFPFLFGYGDVFIQTAGEKQRFVFEQVPRPDEIRKNILSLVEAQKKKEWRR